MVWQMPNIAAMNPHDIIRKIEAYSEETGLKKSTICQMAFGNARYFDRLSDRVYRLTDENERFDRFVEERAPTPDEKAGATT